MTRPRGLAVATASGIGGVLLALNVIFGFYGAVPWLSKGEAASMRAEIEAQHRAIAEQIDALHKTDQELRQSDLQLKQDLMTALRELRDDVREFRRWEVNQHTRGNGP